MVLSDMDFLMRIILLYAAVISEWCRKEFEGVSAAVLCTGRNIFSAVKWSGRWTVDKRHSLVIVAGVAIRKGKKFSLVLMFLLQIGGVVTNSAVYG